MASADVALKWMRDRLGIGEHPPGSNCNDITAAWGLGCVPWCSESVSMALNAAWSDETTWQVPGVAADYHRGTAYVPNLRNHFDDAGLYDDSPRVGDVVIYSWDGSRGRGAGDHTGLVSEVYGDGSILALEGNHNDDMVEIRRSMAVIDGFGHPPYDAPPVPTDVPVFTGELKDRTRSDGARQWQARMAERTWSVVVDGDYGPASARICRQFQAGKALTVDGVVGPITWDATWRLPVA